MHCGCYTVSVMFSPISVVFWQRVGNVTFRHQHDGPQNEYEAAGGQKKEGGAERDSLLMHNLDAEENHWLNITSK